MTLLARGGTISLGAVLLLFPLLSLLHRPLFFCWAPVCSQTSIFTYVSDKYSNNRSTWLFQNSPLSSRQKTVVVKSGIWSPVALQTQPLSTTKASFPLVSLLLLCVFFYGEWHCHSSPIHSNQKSRLIPTPKTCTPLEDGIFS